MQYNRATVLIGNRINNKLAYVDDGDAPSAYSLDIDDQNPANYSYDASGNLVSDVSESIDLIRWTASGKVQGVERTSAGRTSGLADLEFYYDALGNRIKKQVNTLIGGQGVITTTFYVTDPQGNVIAIYEELEESGDDVTYLREQPIYGSDRIGMWRPNVEVYRSGSGTGWGNRVIVTEVNYDSPATHPDSIGGNEERVGEHLVLWNPRNDTVQLNDVKLKNWENDTEIELGASDSLLPYQKMLLHYGSSSDDSLFRLRSLISDSVLDDAFLQRRWHTGLKLNDTYGAVGMIYTVGDGTETRVDTFSYGASLGLVAENAYVVPEDMDSLDIREANWSLRRQTYNSTLNGVLWNPPSNALAKQGGQVGGMPVPAPFAGNDFQLAKGGKNYELKNHLGNVLMVVSDLKLGQEIGTADDTVEYYVPEVLAARDYYPFGMLMPERKYTAETYRFGFNGKENDDEWKGEGNSQDYGFRINDPRLGRFLSVDPLAPDYPWYTAYQFAGNKPVNSTDRDGLEEMVAIRQYGDVKAATIGDPITGEHLPIDETFINLGLGLHPIRDFTNKHGIFKALNVRISVFHTTNVASYLQLDKGGDTDNIPLENAFRHALGQAVLTSRYGSEVAKDAADLHERTQADVLTTHSDKVEKVKRGSEVLVNWGEIDSFVDQLNNEVGRTIGTELQGSTNKRIELRILEELAAGNLYSFGSYQIIDGEKFGVVKRSSISSERVAAAKSHILTTYDVIEK